MGGSFLKYAVVVPTEEDHGTLEQTFTRLPMSDTNTRTVADVLSDALNAAFDAAEDLHVQTTGIGVCTPGPFDWNHGVSLMLHKFLSIRGRDLRALVWERVPRARNLGLRFLPDSQAFAEGERVYGAAKGWNRCLYVTLGTGIGSALSEGDRIISGIPGKSPDGAIWDAPYKEGIAEDYLSRRALLREYAKLTRNPDFRGMDVSEVSERARHGEFAAREVFRVFGRDLGAALRSYAFDFQPQCVVVGGGISSGFDLFEKELREEMRGMSGLNRIAVSSLGDQGPLLGIAELCQKGNPR